MHKIKFSLRNHGHINADGKSMLLLNLRIDGKAKDIPTYIYVPRKNWCKDRKQVIPGKGLSRKAALEYNLKCEETLEQCKGAIDSILKSGQLLTHELFIQRIKKGAQVFEFVCFVENYLEKNADNWGKATLHSYMGALKVLRDHFGTVYNEQLPDFRKKVEKTLFKIGNSVNTRKKRHQQYKTLLARAREAGYDLPIVYDKPIGQIKGNRAILSPQELQKALDHFNHGLLSPSERISLRLFLFSCFTGCRISDIKNLSHKNINGDVLTYIAQKTKNYNKEVQVPLPEVARKLIEHTSGRLFTVISDQKINQRLKTIFRELKINKHITFHSSRHTFGTLYIYLGGDVTNLQLLMAHSNIDTTMAYVHSAKRIDVNQKNYFDKEFAPKLRKVENSA